MFTNRMQENVVVNRVAVQRSTRVAALAVLLLACLAIGSSAFAQAGSRRHAHENAHPGGGDRAGWKTAQLTTFTSYPPCCKGSPAYDRGADKSECEDYSGCKYQGEFAAIGRRPFAWVKANNIVAFYDDSDRGGKMFDRKYAGKKIKLRKNGREFTAIIADTCGNQDCNNCCAKNSTGGYLVDMEYWTAQRFLGGADKAAGTIEFKILE